MKRLFVWSALMLALSLCGGVREDLQSARTFEADYRSGKIDAVFAAGNAKGQVIHASEAKFTEKGLEVGADRASIRYISAQNLNVGSGAVEIVFENVSYEWNGTEKNMLLQCVGKDLTFYIYKHAKDGLGAHFNNRDPKWTAFPRMLPARMSGRGRTHLVINYSADAVQAYVNGRLARSIKPGSAPGAFGKYFTIGAAGTKFARDGVSVVAKVVAYNRPLTKEEIVALNRNDAPAPVASAPAKPAPAPVATAPAKPAPAPVATAPAKPAPVPVATAPAPAPVAPESLAASGSAPDYAAKFANGKDAYKLLVFSDWHYDRMEFHNPPDPKRMWVLEQAKRYSGLWEKYSRDVMDAANRLEGGFVISCGDSLEGYFSTPEYQAQALRELDALVKKHLKRPWVTVVGNHEYGPAANLAAYFRTAAELGLTPPERSFSVRYGKDLYIFWDNISARMDFIRAALKSHPDARYVFLVCHLPVLPVSGRSTRWIAFGYEPQNIQRRELLDLLCERNAIVLCGHIHVFSRSEYTGEKGRISQVTVNSTIDNFSWKTPKARQLDAEYPFVQTMDWGRVKDEPSMRSFLDEYKSRISGVEVFNAVGYGQLKVDDDGIAIDMYCGTDEQPFAAWKLR